jgi:CubicO group peptidase (beta-lactamase class C family)
VHWRDNEYRDQTNKVPYNRELASGMFVNANAMARVGLLFLRKGLWANDQRVLQESFVTTVSAPVAANASLPNPQGADFPNATVNYGVLWWTNANGQLPNVPHDAFWAWGLGDSLIVVIPSLDIVAVRAGAQAAPGSSPQGRVWNDDNWNGDYAVLAPFLDPIVQSVSQ